MNRRYLPTLRQRGASLIFALVTLVILGLATLALVRVVDTGALTMGNLSFKQDATTSGDQAIRTAFQWLRAQTGAILGEDQAVQGYYASSRDQNANQPLDLTGQSFTGNAQRVRVNWDGAADCAGCLTARDAGTTPNGNNRLSYVIFRLCALTDSGAAASGAPNDCATPTGAGGGPHEAGEREPRLAVTGAYYRIVVRVQGTRNSVSFLETIAQL